MQKSHDIRIKRPINKRLDGGAGVPARAGLRCSTHDRDSIAGYATGSKVSYTLTMEI